jgi:hypothetical protein
MTGVQSVASAGISLFAACPDELWILSILILTVLRGSFPKDKATIV